MPSITSWLRLEPRSKLAEPERSLEARVHDPAWMLARQWQLGEFRGEDGGAPVEVALSVQRAALTRYRAGLAAGPGEPLERTAPLDAVVAGVDPPADVRLRARAGVRLLDALVAAGLPALADHYRGAAPFAVPTAPAAPAELAAEELAVLAGRVPDGARLLAIVKADVAGADPAVALHLAAWLAWATPLLAPRPGAWAPTRLEYQFAVEAADAPPLIASELRGGELDWYHLDVARAPALGATEPAVETVVTTSPAPVRYPGMPASRFWQFEDDAVYFGGVEAGARDLGRMLFVELALIGADDWFVVPISVVPGAAYAIARLDVTDSFGRVEHIDPADAGLAGGPRWSMFRPTAPIGPPLPWLVAVASGGMLAAEQPAEDLRLVRDEAANLGWGIERRVADPFGRPVELADVDRAVRPPDPPPGDALVYRVRTDVPPTYVPLVPRELAPGAIELVRGRLLGGSGELPRGQLLGELAAIAEDALPRAGLRVVRRWRYARWIDGSIHVFAAREVELGAAAPASELAFDVVRPTSG